MFLEGKHSLSLSLFIYLPIHPSPQACIWFTIRIDRWLLIVFLLLHYLLRLMDWRPQKLIKSFDYSRCLFVSHQKLKFNNLNSTNKLFLINMIILNSFLFLCNKKIFRILTFFWQNLYVYNYAPGIQQNYKCICPLLKESLF